MNQVRTNWLCLLVTKSIFDILIHRFYFHSSMAPAAAISESIKPRGHSYRYNFLCSIFNSFIIISLCLDQRWVLLSHDITSCFCRSQRKSKHSTIDFFIMWTHKFFIFLKMFALLVLQGHLWEDFMVLFHLYLLPS